MDEPKFGFNGTDDWIWEETSYLSDVLLSISLVSNSMVDRVTVGAGNLTKNAAEILQEPSCLVGISSINTRSDANSTHRSEEPSVLDVTDVVIFWTRNSWPSRKGPIQYPSCRAQEEISSLLQVVNLVFPRNW